jgi:ribosomal protein S18 acetylase RimI-like enzyme
LSVTTRAEIRPAVVRDVDAVLRLQFALDDESEFMLLSPDERSADPVPLRERLQAIEDGDDPSYLLVAVHDDRLVGYVDVSVLPYCRARRTGHLVMGVRSEFQGQGVGAALMTAAIAHGAERGLWRLELTVMEDNRAALALYLSSGFQVEGLRRDAIDLGGRPVSEYYMGRLLTGER